MDGLDLAFATFTLENDHWTYVLHDALTIPYDDRWKEALSNASGLKDAESLKELDLAYGHFLGEQVRAFLQKQPVAPLLIASHGHTVFHRPDEGITLQIGDGQQIANHCGIPVVYDFRSQDVALGGQGAPLVPAGDRLLFGDFAAAVNLGGFSNISFEENGIRKAYDISPVNIVINALAERLGQPFDKDGTMAAGGRINADLFQRLNALPYYRKAYPKSLGREWVEEHIFPLLEAFRIPVADKIRTFTEHTAKMIADNVKNIKGKILFTGGGVYNKFLIHRIETMAAPAQMVIPDNKLTDYKEALIFAFLGVLRWRNEINVLASVTGASKDSCSGKIAFPETNR